MSLKPVAAVLPGLLLGAAAQQIGTAIPELHPRFPTYRCTVADGCVERQTSLVTDALTREFHAVDDPSISCSTRPFNEAICPDEVTCAQNCALEGIDYGGIGVMTRGNALTMRQYLFNGTGYDAVTPRVYLLAEDEENYEMMKLVNQELSFDVDISQLACGMNGALYLSEMFENGGKSDSNPAGAAYGTGYCDAQCFTDPTWANGLPNLNDSGICCNEMDIWEANSRSQVYTPHTCSGVGSFLCTGDECAREGVCDKSGCGFNPYRTGATGFYGLGGDFDVDTSRPFTVVTQFISDNESAEGALTEIKRLYVQDGRVIENVPATEGGEGPGTVTDEFCTDNGADDFLRLGGLKTMGESLQRGMVLIFSIWNSPGDFMEWLDSGEAGPCSDTEGDPVQIVRDRPDLSVTFSNIRIGEIGSTFDTESGAGALVEAEAGAATAEQSASQAGDLSLPTTAGVALIIGFYALFW
ncbi:related to Endo-beta-1,4-glucanase celB [Cephalotrichum gorgonifer]|uniref:Glucanase n=1 Tax=Cephalotrichum gorgonifer TaxID=2041049 RepID=A0AAE8STX2_9PEZI|nr:related to Endo-beta-1,4-glucanase celB [Cephalotrichum gorgonifer]